MPEEFCGRKGGKEIKKEKIVDMGEINQKRDRKKRERQTKLS